MPEACVYIEGPVTDDELAAANVELQRYRSTTYQCEQVTFVRFSDFDADGPAVDGVTFSQPPGRYFSLPPSGVDPADDRENIARVNWPVQGTYLHVAVRCWPGRVVSYATQDLTERHDARAIGPRLTREWLNPAVHRWENSRQRRTCTHEQRTLIYSRWDEPLNTVPELGYHRFYVECDCGLTAAQPARIETVALVEALDDDDRNLVLNLVSQGTVSWAAAITAVDAVESDGFVSTVGQHASPEPT